ncbi:MAG: tRNA (guanosine(37)-N1)-methyltransferase TrmD [Sphingobacteriia bacterium]|nr:tRNA (guanosine(37)-N1)-methyltransferase TrmD [Sphingobacteriia bacterium]
MTFHVLTLFPEMFPGTLKHSLAGKALGSKWELKVYNIRDYSQDKHQNVDEKPFGGGAGMVMRPDVLGNAIENIINEHVIEKQIYFTPRGKVMEQNYISHLTNFNSALLLCGRFEGIDQRIIDFYNFEEISLGDFIMSGGEISALALIDACIRLLPGVINNQNALSEESFSSQNEFSGLLEYPLYTRPSEWNGLMVPEVLMSGNHKEIKNWRHDQAMKITKERRSDLWSKYKES